MIDNKEKFWMVITINGVVEVDSDEKGNPLLYTEKDAQSRAKVLALKLGSDYRCVLMEAIYAEVGKMTTEKIILQRPTNLDTKEIDNDDFKT